MTTTDRLREISQRALSNFPTLLATYHMARYCIEQNVLGDFVECGVFAGAQCAAMACAILDAEDDETGTGTYGSHYWEPNTNPNRKPDENWVHTPRRIHLFDSFTGVPLFGSEDTEWAQAGHPEGESACSLDQVKQHMREWGIPNELLVYHEGPFMHTLPIAAEFSTLDRIALLRIDADLYSSTALVLEHFYPLVSPGGWIAADDYALASVRKAIDEYMLRKDGPGYGPIYWQKQ